MNDPASTTWPGFEREPVRRDLVGEPGHGGGGMIEHAGGEPGFFQLAVAIAQRADPAQIRVERAQGTAAEHNAGIGRVVGDGVEDLARRFGFAVDPLDPGVENFQRRHHEIRRVEHVEQGAAGSGQPLLHHKGKLGLDPRADKAVRWHEAAIGKEHVVEQNPGVRLVDAERALHRLRCETDLVAFDDAALGDLDFDPRLLDRVGVRDGDSGMIER